MDGHCGIDCWSLTFRRQPPRWYGEAHAWLCPSLLLHIQAMLSNPHACVCRKFGAISRALLGIVGENAAVGTERESISKWRSRPQWRLIQYQLEGVEGVSFATICTLMVTSISDRYIACNLLVSTPSGTIPCFGKPTRPPIFRFVRGF